MRLTCGGWLLAIWMIGTGAIAQAQSTTGTIRGQVLDPQGLALPGTSVTVASPNLQGLRSTVTSEHGDYVLTLLPPGSYEVKFELSGFDPVRRDVTLAPTQVVPLDVAFTLAGGAERVNVVGTADTVLSRSSQAATRFSQDLVRALPTNRDISSTLLIAPGVHQSGPNGAYSISGAVSFENLFMVNGASVVENSRGTPHDLYIEDAIQETAIATAGISAEYGRFTGGVVNVITKSGGNRFSGSFRDTLQNDKWRAFAPTERYDVSHGKADPRVSNVVPTYEYTLGGPAIKDRLWFFAAGRAQTQETARTLVTTDIPYVFAEEGRRFEVNATYAIRPSHRLQGVYIESNSTSRNSSQSATLAMDLNSLFDARRLMNLSTVNYSGVISPSFFVEGRFSVRNETLRDVGSRTTDKIDGTLLIEQNTGRRYWAPTFCGVCGPEERDSQDIYAKGSYFLSTERLGSHELSFGVDSYNDSRFANNHQSGSDYRITNTTSIPVKANGTTVLYARFVPGVTQITWQPIWEDSQGSNFRTHSLFLTDSWRVSSRLTANLGLRYDRNHGENGVGDLIAKDSEWSPRLGFVFDPDGNQRWAITGSVSQYVAAVANSVADASSPGGNPDTYNFLYNGAPINPVGTTTLVQIHDALTQVFNWFEANGGAKLPVVGTNNVRGLTPQFRDSLKSPSALEYASGVSRQLNARASVRADFTYRTYRNFYAQRTDMSTGRVTDTRPVAPTGLANRQYDLTLFENTNLLKRQYVAGNFQGQYRPASGIEVGANYTLSRLWGNADAENANSGPTASDILQYPEYKQMAWNAPEGDLSADQRHRARVWAVYTLPRLTDFSIGLVQLMESGVPYGAVGLIATGGYVTNPGYVSAPSATSPTIPYYFTARDAFRTEGQVRTDISLNYGRRLKGSLEAFGQFQVLNLFNNYQVCGCAANTVFGNGGGIVIGRIDQTVSAKTAFNPFTTQPQRGVNWDYSTNFGNPTQRVGFTTPRTLRLSFGVRF